MEDLLILTPDAELRRVEGVNRLPDGLIRPHIIRSVLPEGATHTAASIEGIQKLVQEVWIDIISDRTVDGSGSGMATALKTVVATREAVFSAARFFTALIQTNVIRQQSIQGNLPAAEQLRSLRLLDARLDNDTLLFEIDLELRSIANVTAIASYSLPRNK